MQKRKFDELISHFNRKVSDMSIAQKYKIELLGMISAIGVAHEKELGTNLAEVGTDCISRQAAIDAFNTNNDELVVLGKENAYAVERYLNRVLDRIKQLPPIQPEPSDECERCMMEHMDEMERLETELAFAKIKREVTE